VEEGLNLCYPRYIKFALLYIGMLFEEQGKSSEKFGERAGYLFSYFLFSTAIYYIAMLLNKAPSYWSYFHAMGIAALVAITGIIVKRLLK